MHRKWILILIVVLLFSLFILLYLKQNSSIQTKTDFPAETGYEALSEVKPSDQKPAKKGANKDLSEALDLSAKDKINGIPTSEYLAEIKNPVYSEDPVLEVLSLGVDFRICGHPMEMLTKKTEKNPELIALKGRLMAKCARYAEQYPLLFKTHNQQENVLSLPTNSMLGEQFKYILAGFYGKHDDLSFDQLLDAQFELSLQLKNPNLISFGAPSVGIGITAPLEKTAFFMDLLQTQVNLWVLEAHNLALQLLACDLPNSQSCEATSFYMLYWCQNQPAACGLTVQQWYADFTTPGMKKDVAIIKDYYLEKYP